MKMKKVILIPLIAFSTQAAFGQSMVSGTAEQNAAQQLAAQQAAMHARGQPRRFRKTAAQLGGVEMEWARQREVEGGLWR